VCESEGVFPPSVALAATSDGVYWLASRFFHDTDEYDVDGINTHDCWRLVKRTVKSDVVLIRVSPDGSSARSKSWTYSFTTGNADDVDVAPIAMTARGSRLFLAIPKHEVADIFVLDSTKL